MKRWSEGLRAVGLMASLAIGCGGNGSDGPKDAKATNAAVKTVIVVGTSVTNKIYETGEYGLTLVPKDADGKAVLGAGLKVNIAITAPANMYTSQVKATECVAPQPGSGLSVGVIIDDSGSMNTNDKMLLRKDAAVAFIETIGANDEVLLTDYGPAGNNLRDLVCLQSMVVDGGTAPVPAANCSPPTAAGFTNDKTVLKAATAQVRASGGTPLYESCVQMVPLVASRAGKRHAILLLSDGQPSSMTSRDKCHADALAAGIPVFTVGLGPAAEVMMGSETAAVKVLRELSTATGAAYASANDPAQLVALFSNVGTALAQGKCGSNAVLNEYLMLLPGTRISGQVTVGDNNAMGVFEFVAPSK